MSDGQGNNDNFSPNGDGPCFELGQVYLVDDFIRRCHVSKNTFDDWVRRGLKVFRPSTKARYVFTDDVINFWRYGGEDKA